MDFVWININDINKYTIHPTNINKMLTNTKDIFHLVEEVNL